MNDLIEGGEVFIHSVGVKSVEFKDFCSRVLRLSPFPWCRERLQIVKNEWKLQLMNTMYIDPTYDGKSYHADLWGTCFSKWCNDRCKWYAWCLKYIFVARYAVHGTSHEAWAAVSCAITKGWCFESRNKGFNIWDKKNCLHSRIRAWFTKDLKQSQSKTMKQLVCVYRS